MRCGCALMLTLMFTVTAAAQENASPWKDWQMLIGEWVADEAHGQPGSPASSSFSLRPELDGKVLVRRDRSDYPAAQGRPAFTHEGLMIIYQDPAAKAFRASSFDNEGHVIEYDVDIAPGTRIVFTSPLKPETPRYRLVYEAIPAGLSIRFAIAPANRPTDFVEYVAGVVRRTASR